MAVDKLVDSTKLDACLDAEADAIRAKTGGSADIPFDFANNKGFADAIAAIPTGGGDPYDKLVATNNNELTSMPTIQGLTNIRGYMFYGCSSLTSFDFANVTGFAIGCFRNAGLVHVFCQNKIVSGNAESVFRGCTNLVDAVFTKGCDRIDTSWFENCSNLKRVDFGGNVTDTSFKVDAFYNTQAIEALILRKNGVVSLSGAFPTNSALRTSSIIYVPSAYVDSYKAATNWSAYADRILQIEGSQYEHYYADGTPIPSE